MVTMVTTWLLLGYYKVINKVTSKVTKVVYLDVPPCVEPGVALPSLRTVSSHPPLAVSKGAPTFYSAH